MPKIDDTRICGAHKIDQGQRLWLVDALDRNPNGFLCAIALLHIIMWNNLQLMAVSQLITGGRQPFAVNKLKNFFGCSGWSSDFELCIESSGNVQAQKFRWYRFEKISGRACPLRKKCCWSEMLHIQGRMVQLHRIKQWYGMLAHRFMRSKGLPKFSNGHAQQTHLLRNAH